jgi:hypothetical protein
LNLYAYVHNNPISWIDPFGLKDYNASETQVWLTEAFSSATAGPVQGLLNIHHNSTDVGPYDFGWNEHKNDTWNVDGQQMNADKFANFMAGFQAQAYDDTYPVGNAALNIAFGVGVWDHLTGDTKAVNDPWDNTGVPFINAGAEYAKNWPTLLNSLIDDMLNSLSDDNQSPCEQ